MEKQNRKRKRERGEKTQSAEQMKAEHSLMPGLLFVFLYQMQSTFLLQECPSGVTQEKKSLAGLKGNYCQNFSLVNRMYRVMTITKRMILMKNMKLLSVFQLLCMLHGTNIYMNNILVMLNILRYSCASNEHWF